MALQIVSEFSGIDLPDAYCRVSGVSINTPADRPYSIGIHVEVFASAAAKAKGGKPINGMDFSFTDVPEKIETKPVLVDGKPSLDKDGAQITAEIVTPAKPDFTDLYKILMAGGDPRAMVYEALKSRRIEFAASEDV